MSGSGGWRPEGAEKDKEPTRLGRTEGGGWTDRARRWGGRMERWGRTDGGTGTDGQTAGLVRGDKDWLSRPVCTETRRVGAFWGGGGGETVTLLGGDGVVVPPAPPPALCPPGCLSGAATLQTLSRHRHLLSGLPPPGRIRSLRAALPAQPSPAASPPARFRGAAGKEPGKSRERTGKEPGKDQERAWKGPGKELLWAGDPAAASELWRCRDAAVGGSRGAGGSPATGHRLPPRGHSAALPQPRFVQPREPGAICHRRRCAGGPGDRLAQGW